MRRLVRRLCWLAVALFAVMTASTALGPVYRAFDLLTHPRPHYVAGLIVGIAAAALVRAWGAALLAGVLAAPHMLVMADLTLASPAAADDRTDHRAVIATLNLQHGPSAKGD